MSDRKTFALFVTLFLVAWFLPVESPRLQGAIHEALALTQWYAREHVLLCLVPAFFIAGAIAVFVSQQSVMRYLGAQANRLVSYGVASVSGSVLAVCSCTVLPLFAGIYARGAGLGPATAFLYAGPAINVLAMIMTARILGLQLGIARAVGAVAFSVVIGVLMAWLFRKEEQQRLGDMPSIPEGAPRRTLGQTVVYFALMVGLLVFLNWGAPDGGDGALWHAVYDAKWWISAALAVALAFVVGRWFGKDELMTWGTSSWDYAKLIFPLLLGGVLIAGFLLGRPGHEGIIPSAWVEALVGGNSLTANFLAALVGAFMYFATLTEVPIVQGLMGSGMGDGPALALLLAGPALSLPSMLVIRQVLGTKKTLTYVALVVAMATLSGWLFGHWAT
jgi:uncharacterized membrane protein YraQ (UPF0718 family)